MDFFPKVPFQHRDRSLRCHFSQPKHPQTCRRSRLRESFLLCFAQISLLFEPKQAEGPTWGAGKKLCVWSRKRVGSQQGGTRVAEGTSCQHSDLVPGWEEERVCISFLLLFLFISFSIVPSLNILTPNPHNPLVGQATFPCVSGTTDHNDFAYILGHRNSLR